MRSSGSAFVRKTLQTIQTLQTTCLSTRIQTNLQFYGFQGDSLFDVSLAWALLDWFQNEPVVDSKAAPPELIAQQPDWSELSQSPTAGDQLVKIHCLYFEGKPMSMKPKNGDMYACQKCSTQIQITQACECDSACADFQCCNEAMKNITEPTVTDFVDTEVLDGSENSPNHESMAEQAERAKKI